MTPRQLMALAIVLMVANLAGIIWALSHLR